MQFPFKIIESSYSTRSEFHVTDGYQPTHALFYLKKGSFVIETNGVKEKVFAGDCYILPDYIHYRRNIIEPIEFVYVKFAGNNVCPYKIEIPFGKIRFTDKQRFVSNIANLEKLLSKDDAISAGYREHLLLDILFQIYSESHPKGNNYEESSCSDALVNSAISYINENLSRKILIEQICRNTGTNASTLNFRFRRELNLSVLQYITLQRIKKARKMLTGTSYSISEIAQRCGFENVYYFSKCFSKHTGMPPSKYRMLTLI